MNIEKELSRGHHNSLGNTVKVVEVVLKDPSLFEELFSCYRSEDEVVRLRVSNAMKRIAKANTSLLVPYINRFLNEIGELDQASAQWTLAQLFGMLRHEMNERQQSHAAKLMKHNLATHHDWIVLNTTMDTLSTWFADDDKEKKWMRPHLVRLQKDSRKSVANRAKKILTKFW